MKSTSTVISYAYTHTYIQTDRQTDRQADRQTDGNWAVVSVMNKKVKKSFSHKTMCHARQEEC